MRIERPDSPVLGISWTATDTRRLIIQAGLALLGLMAILALVGYLFRAPLVALSRTFVGHLGGPGVAIGFFLPDAFTVPIPNDAFSMFGLLGGLGFWTVVFWGSLGSLAGGSVGFGIGRLLEHTPWLKRLMATRGAEVHGLVRRYGAYALALAALTPIPYSLACWAAGAGEMRFSSFFAVSLLRIVRVAGYLWLIKLGIVTFAPGT